MRRSAADRKRWLVDLAVHRQVESLYGRVDQARIYFRAPAAGAAGVPVPRRSNRGVDRDRIICALAIKAATTKRAIMSLCRAGDGRNALALTRIILENVVLLEWLTRDRDRVRLDTYTLFMSVLRERGSEKLSHFYQRFAKRPTKLRPDPYDAAIAAHVFQSKHDTWAYFPNPRKPGELKRVNVREMFEEITKSKRPVEYEIYYAMGSDEVHSSPLSLTRAFATLRHRDTFTLTAGDADVGDEALIALALSNTAMLLVMDSLNEYTGCGLESQIERIKQRSQRGTHVRATKTALKQMKGGRPR